MRESLFNLSKKKEIWIFTAIILFFMVVFRDLLFNFSRTLSHDSIWFYGLFHYFAENLQNGVFPFWDPYNYCGQPFYTEISLIYILNPVVILCVFMGKLLSLDLFRVYHWIFFVKLIFFNTGVYLLIREKVKYTENAFLVLLVCLFSSITFSSLRQMGILHSIIFCPWSIMFFMRFVSKKDLKDMIGFAFFTGLAMTGYNAVVVLMTLGLLLLTMVFNKKHELKGFFNRKGLILCLLMIIILSCFSFQLLSLYVEKDKYVPLAREKTTMSKDVEFENGKGGISSSTGDLAGLFLRNIAGVAYFQDKKDLSEGFLHIGVLALFIALFGLVKGQDKWKINIFLVMLFTLLIMLSGANGLFLRSLGLFCPFVKMLRHTFIFSGVFIFCLLYFLRIGLDALTDRLKKNSHRQVLFLFLLIVFSTELFLYAKQTYPYVTMKTPVEEIDSFSQTAVFDPAIGREPEIVTTGYIRYYKPILHKTRTAFDPVTIPLHLSSNMSMNIFELKENVRMQKGGIFDKQEINLNVHDFLVQGFNNYGTWKVEKRQFFLDILYLIDVHMLTNKDFYFKFHKIPKILTGYGQLLSFQRHQLLQSKYSSQDFIKMQALVNYLMNIDTLIKTNFSPEEIAFLNSDPQFRNGIVLHNMLFNRVSLPDFLDYIYSRGHRQEFTILQMKQYREFLNIYNKKGLSPKVKRLFNTFMGIEHQPIRFYSRAFKGSKKEILDSILETPSVDTLYLESFGKGVVEYSSDIEQFQYKVLEADPNKIRIKVYTPSQGWLYISDAYDTSWYARVDGSSQQVIKANICFKAISIEKGEHIVEFVYTPKLYVAGLMLYYGCFFVLIGWFLIAKKNVRDKLKRSK